MTPSKLPVRIGDIARAAEDALFFRLEPLDGQALPAATAGAHIDVSMPNGVTRSYSLLEADPQPRAYTIAVKRELASRGGSAWMHESARVGDTLVIAPPVNHFGLVEAAPHSVLIAGGIGITPVWCMARRLQQLGKSFELHYRARSRESAVLLDELHASGLREHVHLGFSDDASGRRPDIDAIVGDAPQGSHFYCCGPAGMIESFHGACRAVDPVRVHVEQFSADIGVLQTGFLLKLKKSGLELRIEPGDTILQRLRAMGLDVPASCEQGVCGSCETRVLHGCPDHKDLILSAQEKQAGTVMMICCSGALSPELELDL